MWLVCCSATRHAWPKQVAIALSYDMDSGFGAGILGGHLDIFDW